MTRKEEQIQAIMQGLKCDRSEAEEVYACDKKIDKGEAMPFDLSPEQQKNAQKIIEVKEKTTKPPKKNDMRGKCRSADTEKEDIIIKTAEFLEDFAENVQILNKSRLISFNIGNNRYEFTLVKKR